MSPTAMPSTASSAHQEPVGIVIADGAPGCATTRFAAYVWGPVPDEADALEPAAIPPAPAAAPALGAAPAPV